MSSKKWFIMLIFSILIITITISGFNMFTDPFGIYGDKYFNWYSYNFTNNPRASKIAYLDKNYKKFDSYLIGSSSTSSFPIDSLNKYMNANFYNLFMYGADVYDVEKTVEYAVKNYDAKNIVLNLGVINAEKYNYETDKLTDSLHAKVDDSSLLKFHTKYLFANPKYGINKISRNKNNRGYLPESHNVFDVSTGSYNKSLRDIESIQDVNSYKEKYPSFENYPDMKYTLEHIDDLVRSVKNIKDVCDENEVNLKVVFFPMYYEHSRYLNAKQVEEVYTRIAEITEFWDFSVNSITTDPRFYYDETHFRNTLGEMALAKVFNDKDVYMPEDFGVYVTKENAKEQAKIYETEYTFDDTKYTKKVPILMYHHLSDESKDTLEIKVKKFEEQIKAISEDGYNAVSLKQLIDYVEKGVDLPENPIVITFDDGYYSNYEFAYPILKEYGMKGTIFVIGSSVGKEKYKDTENPIIPHFSYEEAREMINSGVMEIQSHTYDMHQWPPFEEKNAREGLIKSDSESEENFIKEIKEDIAKSKKEIKENTDNDVFALSYPLGEYSNLTEAILKEVGIKTTLTINPGTNTIIKGLPQSLQALKRYPVNAEMSGSELIKMLSEN